MAVAAADQRFDAGEEALIRRIHRESAGNPFFFWELVMHLVETGTIVHLDGRWTNAPDAFERPLPESIREVVELRLAGLDEQARIGRAGRGAGRDRSSTTAWWPWPPTWRRTRSSTRSTWPTEPARWPSTAGVYGTLRVHPRPGAAQPRRGAVDHAAGAPALADRRSARPGARRRRRRTARPARPPLHRGRARRRPEAGPGHPDPGRRRGDGRARLRGGRVVLRQRARDWPRPTIPRRAYELLVARGRALQRRRHPDYIAGLQGGDRPGPGPGRCRPPGRGRARTSRRTPSCASDRSWTTTSSACSRRPSPGWAPAPQPWWPSSPPSWPSP